MIGQFEFAKTPKKPPSEMNAIIALCHFCDHHGPTTIFCTQAFKYSDQQQPLPHQHHHRHNNHHHHILHDEGDEIEIELAGAANSDQLPHSPPNETTTSTSTTSKTSSVARPILTNSSNVSGSSSLERSSSRTTCKACRAFNKGFHHYISYEKFNTETIVEGEGGRGGGGGTGDDFGRICYISQASPSDSEVFAIVRKACLRTLHCEVFEDPIYFDDDNNGSVIGYEFNIKDCEGKKLNLRYFMVVLVKL